MVDVRTSVVQLIVVIDVCTRVVQPINMSDAGRARLNKGEDSIGRRVFDEWATLESQAAWGTRAIEYGEYQGH